MITGQCLIKINYVYYYRMVGLRGTQGIELNEGEPDGAGQRRSTPFTFI